VRELRDATIEELLGEVFYMWSVLRLYKEEFRSGVHGVQNSDRDSDVQFSRRSATPGLDWI
jgi:hypothetical protein